MCMTTNIGKNEINQNKSKTTISLYQCIFYGYI